MNDLAPMRNCPGVHGNPNWPLETPMIKILWVGSFKMWFSYYTSLYVHDPCKSHSLNLKEYPTSPVSRDYIPTNRYRRRRQLPHRLDISYSVLCA